MEGLNNLEEKKFTDPKLLHKIFGAIVFSVSLIVYFMTVQPSTSFWDCGEFIASAYLLQVPHPPGTPFFLLLGRLFSMLPIDANIGLKVNLISVIASAFTILFLYLIAVKLIENYKGKKHDGIFDSLATYIAASIGALSLAFGDTFWFNAVEAEVYALALFFATIIFWLAFVWLDKQEEAGSERYLLLIAYLLGISLGVHLFAVLTIIPIVMIVMFKKYLLDEEVLKKTGFLFMVHSALILLIAIIMWAGLKTASPPAPEEFRAVDSRFIMMFVVASVIFMGIFRKSIFQKGSFYYAIIAGGVLMMAVYPGVIKFVPKLIASLDNGSMAVGVLLFLAIFAGTGYLVYWSQKKNKATINLLSKSLLFVLIGFSTMAMIIIRSNQDTPINLNSPKTMSEMLSYVNRDQYGEQPMFQRRFTRESHQMGVYENYGSDLDFWARYQMDFMFNRYLLWNYVGRESTTQDAGVDWSKLWGIPFFLGMIGFYFHFRKDWRMATVMLVMLIFLGYLMAFYSNSQQPQPRERDYFYVGAFFVFSIWIAIGVRGLIDELKKMKNKTLFKPAAVGVLALAFLFVPVKMLANNYWEHDRSINFVPWDYAYNMLQSVAEDAVIFTNGDNDTFPLWYLQDVEGVRRDVRVANLSLINTDWYIKQLKNTTPYGSKKVKMTLTDRQIEAIRPIEWKSQAIKLPVDAETYKKYGVTDTSLINKGMISWTMPHTATYGSVTALRPQDLIVKSIIDANKWERPIYFAITVSDDSMIGLRDFLEMEGMALRVTPVRHERRGDYAINTEVMWKQIMEEPDGYSTGYSPGFKFRGLDNKDIFFDSNHQRMTINYRQSFMRLASHLLYDKNDKARAIQVLEKMDEQLPMDVIPMHDFLLYFYGNILRALGEDDKYLTVAREIESRSLASIENRPMDFQRQLNPYQLLFEVYENLNEYDKALELALRIKKLLPKDQGIDALINQFRSRIKQDSSEVSRDQIN